MNMNINWYPGHMKKTLDIMKKSLKMVDIVVEIIDARIPISSRNPIIDEILENKPRVILMNKKDLADDRETRKWIEHFERQGHKTVLINSLTGDGINLVEKACRSQLEDKFAKLKEKQIQSEVIRLMVVGIPNVGKSTFINKIAKRKSARVGNKPGVTRNQQWIKIRGNMELLDTPGVLWPKFEDQEVGLHLAYTGAIKDEIMDSENLAFYLIKDLMKLDPKYIEDRYDIDSEGMENIDIMDAIARRRGFILRGNEIDYLRTANTVLDEFRSGMLGKITLETVEDLNV